MKIRFVDIFVILFMIVLTVVLLLIAKEAGTPLIYMMLIPGLIGIGGVMWALTRD